MTCMTTISHKVISSSASCSWTKEPGKRDVKLRGDPQFPSLVPEREIGTWERTIYPLILKNLRVILLKDYSPGCSQDLMINNSQVSSRDNKLKRDDLYVAMDAKQKPTLLSLQVHNRKQFKSFVQELPLSLNATCRMFQFPPVNEQTPTCTQQQK